MLHFYIRRFTPQISRKGKINVSQHRVGVIAVDVIKHKTAGPLLRVGAALCSQQDKFNPEEGVKRAKLHLKGKKFNETDTVHTMTVTVEEARKLDFGDVVMGLGFRHVGALAVLGAVPTQQHTAIFRRIIDDAVEAAAPKAKAKAKKTVKAKTTVKAKRK